MAIQRRVILGAAGTRWVRNGIAWFRGGLFLRAAIKVAMAGLLLTGAAGAARAEATGGHRFMVPDGCVVEKVAGPPLVRYPLFACFDDQGRLYVAEGTGLNVPGAQLVEKKLGRITRLEDTDGDGRFDKSTLFAGGLVFPQGVLWHDGAVYTASHPNIWKLEDTDGDGRADRREVLVGRFEFTGNGCDIHGPFFGPDGYLYWTDGRHGYDIKCREGHTLKGLAARIFRCRTDGSRIERIAGGGFDNPVELVFSPEGTIIGTMDQVAGDRLLHYVEGGVYPQVEHPCVKELAQTGPPLGAISEFSAALPVALCGVERIRSTYFGPGYQGTLLTAQFNVHRIQQHILRPDGATFRAEENDFLVTFDYDVHPTDVLEDADGSLLMVDMGAWFNYGCPTSKIAKPEVLGAIYRIRRADAPAENDPWGKSLDWQGLSAAQLADLLDDERLKVRDKAMARLAARAAAAVPALVEVYRARDARSLDARRNALWTLARIDHAAARAAVREALGAEELTLRHVALHAVALERDAEALPQLAALVVSEEPLLRLKTAEALGRIGRPDAVPALVASLRRGVTDRFLEHALIYALIRIDDRDSTIDALADPNPNVRRAALIALDQMKSGALTRQLMVPLLDTDDPDLQQTALELISRRPGWASEIHGLVGQWLASPRRSAEQKRSLTGALIAFSGDEKIQQLVAAAMAKAETTDETRLLLLEVMARCRLADLPQGWLDGLGRLLAGTSVRLRGEVVATVRSRGLPMFDRELAALGRDQTLPAALRIAAVECIAPRRKELAADAFDLLTAHLPAEVDPLLRASAARALAAGALSEEQLIRLAELLAGAGSLTMPLLVTAYEKRQSPVVGRALVAALRRAPGAAALTADDLTKLLEGYPAEVHAAARPLVAKLAVRRQQQAAYLAEVKYRLLRTDRNADRGRRVFFSKRAVCSGCHRIDGKGGAVGPDLSQIGRIRSPVDLVEAVIFPSSTIALGYKPYTIVTDDGHMHTGIIVRETSAEILLRTAQLAEIRIPREAVEDMRQSTESIMPRGLEKSISAQELSDLLEFLYSRR